MTIASDQRLVVETPGAGGYGDPAERAFESVEIDRRSGKFSDEYIAEYYNQIIAAEIPTSSNSR